MARPAQSIMHAQLFTILAAVFVTSSLLTLALFSERNRSKQRNRYVIVWSVAGVVGFVGFALIGLYQPGVNDWAVWLGDVLVISSYGLVYQGFRLIEGRAPRWHAAWLPLAVVTASLAWYTFGQPDFAARISIVALAAVVFGLLLARLLHRSREQAVIPHRMLTFVAAGAFALSAVVALATIPSLLQLQGDMLLSPGAGLGARIFVADAIAISIGLAIFLPVVAFARLQHELEISEQRIHYALEAANEGYWDLNLRDGKAFVSMRFNELLGRRPQDLSLDPAELAALIDPADLPGITPIVHACLDGQLAKGSCEFRLAGRTIWISATGHVVERDKAGRALRAVGTVEDVTERRKAQDELQAHRDHLEALVHARTRDLALALDAAQGVNRTRSQLLSNVSHELRTPLNHIVGIGQLLQLEMPTDRSRGLLDQLLGSALMLAKLIGNLLDTAKLESDTLQLRDIEFSLTCLLDDVAAELRPQWEKRGHELIRDVDREIADPLRGDPLRLQQVLVELLDNAAKFSERGPVRLRVRQMQLRAAHADLRFEISDRGPGLSDEVQRQMFQLFWQGDPAATRKHGGMGLGLALTQRLVGLMAGRVGGGPTASGGSMFWIELPFALGPPGKAHADGQDMPPPAARAIADQLLQLIDESHPRARLRWADVAEQIGPLLGDRRTSFETALESADFSAASTILRAAMSAHA